MNDDQRKAGAIASGAIGAIMGVSGAVAPLFGGTLQPSPTDPGPEQAAVVRPVDAEDPSIADWFARLDGATTDQQDVNDLADAVEQENEQRQELVGDVPPPVDYADYSDPPPEAAEHWADVAADAWSDAPPPLDAGAGDAGGGLL